MSKLEADWVCDKRSTRIPSHLQSAKFPCRLQLFYKHCDFGFEELLAVGKEELWRLPVASSLSRPPPVTIWSAHVAANLHGDPCTMSNGKAMTAWKSGVQETVQRLSPWLNLLLQNIYIP